jgi:hypothetical protein
MEGVLQAGEVFFKMFFVAPFCYSIYSLAIAFNERCTGIGDQHSDHPDIKTLPLYL